MQNSDSTAQDAPAGTAAMTPLHPAHRTVLRLRIGAVALAILALSVAICLGPLRATPLPVGLVPGIVGALALLAIIVLPARRYRAWAYREEEDEIHIRHGLFVRMLTIVPFGRVQHIDVAQGPLQRRYGLGTLILHTAGTRGAAVPLPGLAHEEAGRMRDRIRAKIRQDLV